MTGTEVERTVRRIFPRLCEGETYLARTPAGDVGIFAERHPAPLATVDARSWAALERRDLVEPAGGGRWRPSAAGLAYWRRLNARAAPFRAQHQLSVLTPLGEAEDSPMVELNEGEAPLGWLRRRKGADGRPLISAAQFEAGERLRCDFTLARMDSRVTTDWSMAMTADGNGRGGHDPAAVSDRALAARERMAAALDAAGPGLRDVLLAVCCHLQGLEGAEQSFGWPRRSGKIVLQIALGRLAAHYGIEEGASQE